MIDLTKLALFAACNSLTMFGCFGLALAFQSLRKRNWADLFMDGMFCTSAFACAGVTMYFVVRP